MINLLRLRGLLVLLGNGSYQQSSEEAERYDCDATSPTLHSSLARGIDGDSKSWVENGLIGQLGFVTRKLSNGIT